MDHTSNAGVRFFITAVVTIVAATAASVITLMIALTQEVSHWHFLRVSRPYAINWLVDAAWGTAITLVVLAVIIAWADRIRNAT